VKFQDYYEVLGVPRTASADEIRKAYRKLALKWHPDRHKGKAQAEAEATFKQISEAYEVLADAETRKKYDRFGQQWKHGQEFEPPPGSAGGRRMSPEEFASMFGGQASGFSDFFTSMFGENFQRAAGGGSQARHRRFRHRGADLRAELELTVGQALTGGKSSFELPVTAACERCGGVGFLGEHVCPVCVGVGSVHKRRAVDLSSIYRRTGDDVEADVPIAPWEALAGAKVDVRAPDGIVTLTVPPGTKAGQRLRLRGRGLDDGRGGRGNFHAVIRLALPDALNERQAALIREIASAGPSSVVGGARADQGSP
jgi:curved DNA-binding protein